MLSLSRFAVKSISTSFASRSYGKIRELTATVPNKMPKVCSSEEVVESINSGDRVWKLSYSDAVGVGSYWSLFTSWLIELCL